MDRETARALMERINRDAERLALHFGLRYRSIDAERPNVKRRYGICTSDGRIRIRLRHAVTARPLKYSSLIDTLCHELAHLRHFNHGVRFQAFYARILAHARRQGIYRPGPEPRAARPVPRAPRLPEAAGRGVPPRRHAAPEQLTLFGEAPFPGS